MCLHDVAEGAAVRLAIGEVPGRQHGRGNAPSTGPFERACIRTVADDGLDAHGNLAGIGACRDGLEVAAAPGHQHDDAQQRG